MKKIISSIAVLTVLALTLCALPCFAVSEAAVTGECVTTTPGKEIEYRVSICGNPGLTGFLLKVKFDAGALSYLSCSQGDFSAAGSMTCGEANGVCSVMWYHTSDVTSDGTLFTLHFQVNDSATPGEYPVTISSMADYAINNAEEKVALNCTGGSVIVREFVPKFYGEQKSVKQGEDFLFDVLIEDNPGIGAYHIQVLFDASILALADPSQPYQLPDGAFGQNVTAKAYPNALDVIWFSNHAVYSEGALLSLHFTAKPGAVTGDYPITIQYVPEDTVDVDEQPVVFVCNNGILEIKRSADIQICFADAQSAQVTIDGAEGQIIIAAIFDENGKQLAVAMKNASEASASLRLVYTNTASDCCICKVITTDSSFRPLCDVIQKTRT